MKSYLVRSSRNKPTVPPHQIALMKPRWPSASGVFCSIQIIHNIDMERVSALDGDLPILVVAPYGADDSRTGLIAQQINEEVDAFAVINWGWHRAKHTDYKNNETDCNDLAQINSQPVVVDEFLNPIETYVYRILMNWGRVHMFILMGVGDHVRRMSNDGNLDIIIGYGAGQSPFHPIESGPRSSYSCDPRMKDAFAHYLSKRSICVYQGAADGKYAGNNKNCLNQLYRRPFSYNDDVHSMELRIIKELRSDDHIAIITALELADCMEEITLFDDSHEELFLVLDSI